MNTTLDDFLTTLHSDEARLVFLRRNYRPGNDEIATKILELEPNNNHILIKEIDYAIETKNTTRIEVLGRRIIDDYLRRGYASLIKDQVCRWNLQSLAQYAIDKLRKEHEKEDEKSYDIIIGFSELEDCAKIAKQFNDETTERQTLERLLAAYMKKGKEGQQRVATTLEKLGRYDEAIDEWCGCESYGVLQRAIDIAEEHTPSKIRKIKEIGFERFCDEDMYYAEFYRECATSLGKTNEARQRLIEYAQKRIDEHNPNAQYIHKLIEALVAFGEKELAIQLFKSTSRGNTLEDAGIYHALGDNEKAAEKYKECITRRMSTREHPENWLRVISDAYEETKDLWFLERKLVVFELLGRYDEAARVATELNNPQLREKYEKMQQMINEAKGAP